ncbi:hypothetical protein POG77_07025 [Lactococcus petauri]|uniref:hypothetical protein n=1 Tax=Lactococcus petauri TaxID=1940789 RepID=UPI00232B48B5|nr:hypothetical protein [Lactococcus petauri]MDC0815746.1 hypothetical protein [Lactococcus petauri]MDC0817735.1 hypothetical protein [Lactococcus petauri]MDC0824233.1 hypothetical protein [Lactococcus petauri]MDC0830704.1 hypothetical protein [Lactococcus petauri]
MKAMKYFCICILIGQFFINPIFSSADELTLESEKEKSSLVAEEKIGEQEKIRNSKTIVDEKAISYTSQFSSSDITGSIVDSGENGTSKWTLDENGILEIGEGNLGPSSEFGPWKDEIRSQTKKVVFSGHVVAESTSLWALFAGFENLTNLDTSQVTVMDFLFSGDTKLESIDLSSFNTSVIPKEEYGVWQVFALCESLKSIKLGNNSIFSTTSYSGPELPEVETNSKIYRWMGWSKYWQSLFFQ